jgi:hypothetical protein
MTQELYDALEALCMMWDQYCDTEWGHMCMSAGEAAEGVLDRYQLLIHKDGYEAVVDAAKLEEYRKSITHDTSRTPS